MFGSHSVTCDKLFVVVEFRQTLPVLVASFFFSLFRGIVPITCDELFKIVGSNAGEVVSAYNSWNRGELSLRHMQFVLRR